MDQFSRAAANRLPTWVKGLAAPLLMLSVGLHGLLLVVPIPPPPPPPPEPEPTEEFVDLISISELIPPTPVAPVVAPPPPIPAPNQPVLPPSSPVTPQAVGEALSPTTAAAPGAETAPTAPPEEVTQLFTQLTRGSGDSDFDATETLFPFAAYSTRQGIQEWSPQEQVCFFSQISADTYSLRPPALSLRYLTRNVQFIEAEDIPRTFPAPQFEVSQLEGGYCQRSLFQVLKGGQPLLFISVVGIGVGAPGQQATGLVIIWSGDPRTG
jgi:hypothetical protein